MKITRDKNANGIAVGDFNLTASVQGAEELNFIKVGEVNQLEIKILNNGPRSFHIQRAADPARCAKISIDFSRAGKGITIDKSPETIMGFARPQALEGGKAFVYQQSTLYYSFFTGDIITIVFPGVISAEKGCGFIDIRLENMEGHDFQLEVPLFSLQTTAAPNNMSTSWKYPHLLTGSNAGHKPEQNVLKFVINSESGAIHSQDGTYPVYYIQLCDGLSPKFAALLSPEAARDIEASTSDRTRWTISKLGNPAFPLWKLDYDFKKGGADAPIFVKLANIKKQNPAAKQAHILIYYLNTNGLSDAYQIMNVDFSNTRSDENADSNISILFTANPVQLNNIDKPTGVELSWNVKNADFVMLSGTGVVEHNVPGYSVMIEQSTTFVLTAYSKSLSQIVSKNVTVQVAPDLLTRVIPKGSIVMWSGQPDSIPAGWLLCDGSNNTPDLRDKFVVGAGKNYKAGTKGDAKSHQHQVAPPARDFTSSSDGKHNHLMPENWYAKNLSCGVHLAICGAFDKSTTVTQDSGEHQHTVSVSFAPFNSSDNTPEVLPPWFALCYIIKTGV